MKLKELPYGIKFKTLNNDELILIKESETIIGNRHLYHCKSNIGYINLPGELEVKKC